MRAAIAAALALLAVAPPAAAVTGGNGLSAALHSSPFGTAASSSYGKTHSCQAGDRSAKTKRVGGKTFVVACEQPPKSNLLTPGSVAKATASALSVFG